MFIVAGTYNWSARLVAFRRDMCAHCRRETLSLGTRTLDFFHVFWIPILPLGRWTRWRCADCGNDPTQTTAVRRPFRLLLWFLVALMALAFVSVAEVDSEYAIPVWMGRALAAVVVALVGWWAVRSTGSKDYEQRRANVQPYNESACPLCGSQLVRTSTETTCSGCAAEHRPLGKKTDDLVPYS